MFSAFTWSSPVIPIVQRTREAQREEFYVEYLLAGALEALGTNTEYCFITSTESSCATLCLRIWAVVQWENAAIGRSHQFGRGFPLDATEAAP